MLDFKSYSEIDLDESPIVVLGCGHFFTAETLDGHISMHDAYRTGQTGEYIALSRSSSLSQFIPRFPDCQSPIQPYVTQRYNRVINQAVLDETSKRFIVSGNQRLAQFDTDIHNIAAEWRRIKESRRQPTTQDKNEIRKAKEMVANLARKISRFNAEASHKEQPVRKLHDATVKAMRAAGW
jgi:hypothetical protein